MPPTNIGSFQILGLLGRGGMGEVFRARDTRLDRLVAIKSLPPHFLHDQDRVARFEREARVLASLSHPGIAAIHGLEEADGQRYLVLEFVEGETLADRLARGAIPIAESLAIAKQVAAALEAAHEKGVVHRDLKPGNLMVTAEGTVKVLDFGLARTDGSAAGGATQMGGASMATATSPALVQSPTMPGAILGTAGYMSPEQIRGKAVDKRVDIFAFGCVLFEMLAGKPPFLCETVAESLAATLHKEAELGSLPPRRRDASATSSHPASPRTATDACATSAMHCSRSTVRSPTPRSRARRHVRARACRASSP
jgi:serine/threonine protein kinase